MPFQIPSPPPKRFCLKQNVVCINRGPWRNRQGVAYPPMPGILPHFNQFLTVRDYVYFDAKGWYITFEELPERYCFRECYFAPVIDDSVLIEELQSIFHSSVI